MKTLKQHLEEYVKVFIIEDRAEQVQDDILTIVKEWLQEYMDELPNRLEYYYSNEPEEMQTLGRVKQIKKLLKELDK